MVELASPSTSTDVCVLGSTETMVAAFRFIISSYAGGLTVGVYVVSSGKKHPLSFSKVEVSSLSPPFRHPPCVSGFEIKAAEFPLSWYKPDVRMIDLYLTKLDYFVLSYIYICMNVCVSSVYIRFVVCFFVLRF